METRTGANVREVQETLFEAARALIAWQYRIDAFAEEPDEVALVGEAARLARIVEGAVGNAAAATHALFEGARRDTVSSEELRG